MGIAAPPSQPGQTTTYVSQPTKSSAAISGRPATASSMSHSQGFHQGSSGVFGYSPDGFDRPDSSQDHPQQHDQQQQHVAQQSRRDKLRVQGFDPAAAAGHGLLPIDGDEHAEPGAMYEHAAAAAGASNMLSEMFNFPAPPSGPSATELLASQMNANYRFGLRQGPGGVAGLSGDGGWFGAGAAGRAGLVLGGANMGSLGETSSPKQQGSMAGLATDPAAAMQLFLMNPQQQQQQSRSSPTSPQPSDVQQHHEAFQAFGGAAASFGGGGGVVEGQGLSLSLSPSLQQLEMAKQAEELRVRDGVLYFNRQQQQGPSVQQQQQQQLPMALHGQVGALGQQLHVGYGPAGVAGVLRNSKYTRAAQELLEEFCSVGRGQIKGGARGGRGASASNPNAGKGGGGASSSGAAQSPSSASKEPPQLSPADRFEHQRKKAKLISMLDEVDRRYNHYCDQMQMVVNFFDSVMGFGAATPYTALAQKAMSRHFRCLKDAIASQLRHTCELLGEKDAGTSSGLTKGETPRLRAIDQSLRQQRAFHHMGMMEQEAWRPQRGLPERSVNILRSWLFEHFLHPYPSDADKHVLARQTGLSRNQVSNWFINARVRLWKPMIEEMYQQECRELEGSSAGAGGPESGNDPSGADDTHSPTTTGAVAQQLPHHQQQHGTAAPGVMPHKPDPGAAGPSAADAAFVGIDPVELLGGDAHVGGGADDLYGRFEPGVRMRYGPGAAGAAAGDVSLTLGLQHAGAGNAGPDGTGRFSLRDYSGC
ncbi:BEL1-like homeodomain protein 4 [Panicum miliaceum]|uniref:BEL1-like homeodomain protein 4 n=1 Tax=Panicum miliaceum TaxID=4540 RepID=A0A3L6TII2_PANMI|nr:BEL1-like homeodomain protein 4 [Panicum miliaceum]